MGSKPLETKFQKELIQPRLVGCQCLDIPVQKEAHPIMDNRHESSSVPSEFNTELPMMDNGHKSSSVSGGSGHYNEGAMLVDDALLKYGRGSNTRCGAATNWSSAAVGNILGKSAPTAAENVSIATRRASATNASDSTTMPSFCATLLSPKIPRTLCLKLNQQQAVQLSYQ